MDSALLEQNVPDLTCHLTFLQDLIKKKKSSFSYQPRLILKLEKLYNIAKKETESSLQTIKKAEEAIIVLRKRFEVKSNEPINSWKEKKKIYPRKKQEKQRTKNYPRKKQEEQCTYSISSRSRSRNSSHSDSSSCSSNSCSSRSSSFSSSSLSESQQKRSHRSSPRGHRENEEMVANETLKLASQINHAKLNSSNVSEPSCTVTSISKMSKITDNSSNKRNLPKFDKNLLRASSNESEKSDCIFTKYSQTNASKELNCNTSVSSSATSIDYDIITEIVFQSSNVAKVKPLPEKEPSLIDLVKEALLTVSKNEKNMKLIGNVAATTESFHSEKLSPESNLKFKQHSDLNQLENQYREDIASYNHQLAYTNNPQVSRGRDRRIHSSKYYMHTSEPPTSSYLPNYSPNFHYNQHSNQITGVLPNQNRFNIQPNEQHHYPSNILPLSYPPPWQANATQSVSHVPNYNNERISNIHHHVSTNGVFQPELRTHQTSYSDRDKNISTLQNKFPPSLNTNIEQFNYKHQNFNHRNRQYPMNYAESDEGRIETFTRPSTTEVSKSHLDIAYRSGNYSTQIPSIATDSAVQKFKIPKKNTSVPKSNFSIKHRESKSALNEEHSNDKKLGCSNDREVSAEKLETLKQAMNLLINFCKDERAEDCKRSESVVTAPTNPKSNKVSTSTKRKETDALLKEYKKLKSSKDAVSEITVHNSELATANNPTNKQLAAAKNIDQVRRDKNVEKQEDTTSTTGSRKQIQRNATVSKPPAKVSAKPRTPRKTNTIIIPQEQNAAISTPKPNIDKFIEEFESSTRIYNTRSLCTKNTNVKKVKLNSSVKMLNKNDAIRNKIVKTPPPNTIDDGKKLEIKKKRLESKIKNDNLECHSLNKRKFCQICEKPSGVSEVNHYVNAHPNYEVFPSRLAPIVSDNLRKTKFIHKCERVSFSRSTKFKQICYFCNEIKCLSKRLWIQHFVVHSGYYQYNCLDCLRKFVTPKSTHACNGKRNIAAVSLPQFQESKFMAYLCDICNYVRLDKKEIEKHLRCEHKGNDLQKFKKFVFLDFTETENKLKSRKEYEHKEIEFEETSDIKVKENSDIELNVTSDIEGEVTSEVSEFEETTDIDEFIANLCTLESEETTDTSESEEITDQASDTDLDRGASVPDNSSSKSQKLYTSKLHNDSEMTEESSKKSLEFSFQESKETDLSSSVGIKLELPLILNEEIPITQSENGDCSMKHGFEKSLKVIEKPTLAPISSKGSNHTPADESMHAELLSMTPVKLETPLFTISSVVSLEPNHAAYYDHYEKYYAPEDIDSLPRSGIFNKCISCAICNYSTQVANNMYRHLTTHMDQQTDIRDEFLSRGNVTMPENINLNHLNVPVFRRYSLG